MCELLVDQQAVWRLAVGYLIVVKNVPVQVKQVGDETGAVVVPCVGPVSVIAVFKNSASAIVSDFCQRCRLANDFCSVAVST